MGMRQSQTEVEIYSWQIREIVETLRKEMLEGKRGLRDRWKI